MNLPSFRYHPDPLDTGSVIASESTCLCCDRARGYIYRGPQFSLEDLEDRLCPWCIADGSAYEKFEVEFSDPAGIGGYPPADLPVSVVEEVTRRTPGFIGWQQEHWLACCGDAAAFAGVAGKTELDSRWPSAIEAIKTSVRRQRDNWDSYIAALDRDHGPTAYVFQCLHCQRLLAYSDSH